MWVDSETGDLVYLMYWVPEIMKRVFHYYPQGLSSTRALLSDFQVFQCGKSSAGDSTLITTEEDLATLTTFVGGRIFKLKTYYAYNGGQCNEQIYSLSTEYSENILFVAKMSNN